MSDLERAKAEGAKAERERIIAIMSSPEARQNPVLASELAYRQARPAAEAIATLRVFASNPGEAADDGWAAVAEKMNAQAGLTKPTVAANADDPWADVVTKLNGEIAR